MPSPKKSEPGALAAAAFAVAAPIAYVGQRLYEYARSGQVDPLLVLREAHTAFYWRAATAAWWGGVVAVLVFVWARRRAGEVPRALPWVVLPVVVALAALAWRFA